jgi:glycosyltransferase involved in cell wall biosynthesis
VQTRELKECLPKDVDQRKVSIIPNGVDFDRFKPMASVSCCNRLGWDPDRFHILFPKNGGDPVKRLGLAQEAVRCLKQTEMPVELHLLEGVAHHEVPLWLNAADVLLLTSAHEGSPNVVKEALACNRPVVSVDVGDVAQLISDLEGCHLAADEPNDISEKLRQVYLKPRCESGRKRIRELSRDEVSRRILAFYEAILVRYHS